MLEKALESPLDRKENKPVNPSGMAKKKKEEMHIPEPRSSLTVQWLGLHTFTTKRVWI